MSSRTANLAAKKLLNAFSVRFNSVLGQITVWSIAYTLATVEFAFKFVSDFITFFLNSLIEVPLSLSIGSAVIVTFIWLFNEIAGHLMLWRALLIVTWGLIGLDSFIPLRNLEKTHVWAVVFLAAILSVAVARLSRRKLLVKNCPKCGAKVT